MISGTTLIVIGTLVAIVGGIVSTLAILASALWFLWKTAANVATTQAHLREVAAAVEKLRDLPERVAVLEATAPEVRRGKR